MFQCIFSQTIHNGQYILVLLEATLVFGVIWLIFKKKSGDHNLNLTESEKEDIINSYKPDNLVEDVPETHRALNPRIISGKIGLHIIVDGIKCLNFATHDYHGFVGNDEIEQKVKGCIETYGVGSCGPRGFYGTAVEHLDLEKLLAELLEAEDSIVYSYGFATIASAIPAYAKKADIIFVDEKRNFAIQKGLDASKSEIKYFKHNDVRHLEEILEGVRSKDLQNLRKARKSRRYIVVEGICMNTGEICRLPEIVKLCKKFKVRVLIDESVSFGVLGGTGRGVTEYFGVPRADIDLIMGSFEYALASVGGFSAGSRLLTDHQQISGHGYCFSASLPPLLATATLRALHTIQDDPGILRRLNESCRMMHLKLNSSKVIKKYFVVSGDQDSPVHVLTLKLDSLPEHQQQDAEDMMDHLLEVCWSSKVAVTLAASLPQWDVVLRTPCLRITSSTLHTEEHIDLLVKSLEEASSNVFFNTFKNFVVK